MASMNNLMLSMKLILISAGILSIAIGIKFSFPIAMNEIPVVWSVILSWLKPPYLYIIINGIIITIAAASRFHQSQSEPSGHSEHLISVQYTPPSDFPSMPTHPAIGNFMEGSTAAEADVIVYESGDEFVDVKPVMVNGLKVETVTEEEIVAETEAGDVFVDSPLRYNSSMQEMMISPELQQLESVFPVREKPLASSRFGHRKPIRTTPEVPGGRTLRVTRPKRHDTLESTWKAITEGRHMPLTRHLKKSDTWEQHERHHMASDVDHMTKLETGNYRTTGYDSSSRVRKEPSLGQEELNRRVEAFIKKINDDMRMQRQESLDQYMKMINRGV